jgi:hypothetical protein
MSEYGFHVRPQCGMKQRIVHKLAIASNSTVPPSRLSQVQAIRKHS